MGFKQVPSHVSFPEMEEEILAYWKKQQIFEKSVEQRPVDKPWTFLDGPPFVTGMPHYGSLLSSIPKDVFGRYWTMKGYRVRRVWGWDGHGLPIENKVENKLKLKRKKDIEEKVGVKKFINECLGYVDEVSDQWEWYVDHIGRWVDFKNAYKTWNIDYMESVMWVFKQMYDKDLIYKGLRVSLYCPHCSTPISNFEVAMDAENYKDVADKATTYKYKMADEENTYILAWSTTPWNKIVTPALAVNPEMKYVKVKQGDEYYILATTTTGLLGKEGDFEIVDQMVGKDLVGRSFESHFDFYDIEEGKKAFLIIPGSFVTADEGTGVVTIAAYGEDDLKVMEEHDIQVYLHVDDEGHFVSEVPEWGGRFYLDCNDEIDAYLNGRGLIYQITDYNHRVAHCWRCGTRLMHAPQNAWYVDIQTLKPRLYEQNEAINWFPKHFKEGRFLKSMQSAPDWCISRSRYWGSPVPVWETPSGKRFVPGSIDELEQLSGQSITSLHKPEIDEITITDPETGEVAHRVPEVLDSWIEAGSASFAERHYPFAGDQLEDFFPPQFITEYTGQIRAWFYVLHVIGVALFNSNAFENVIVTGVIQGTDGRKMSKNFGNYPDPEKMISTYGGDALRLYLMGSPVMHGEDIRISEQDYRLQVRSFLSTLWNSYKYFLTYAVRDDWDVDAEFEGELTLIDRWILSRLYTVQKDLTGYLDGYDTVKTVQTLQGFVNELSNWYIRRSRSRVATNADAAFYVTLYMVLRTFSQLAAPMVPFISERIYRGLTGEESVHLSDWPEEMNNLIDEQLEAEMDLVRKIVELGHSQRKENKLPVRQPLAGIEVLSSVAVLDVELLDLIKDELNVKSVVWTPSEQVVDVEARLDTELTETLQAEGEARNLIRKIQVARKEAGCSLDETVDVTLPDWPREWENHIKLQTKVRNLNRGEAIEVSRL